MPKPAAAGPAEGTPETKAVTVVTPMQTALAVADGMDVNDTRGKAEMDQADLKLPRIAIAQKTSDEIDPSKPAKFIKGLTLFQMFNTLTKEIYGNGPVNFCVIRQTKKAMEFDKDNKVVRFNVPLRVNGKPNPELDFTEGPNGTRLPPKATLFYEYLVLLENGDLAMLSLKKTQVSTAKDLNSLLTLRRGAAWGGLYALTSGSKQAGIYTVGNYMVAPAGKTPSVMAEEAEAWFTRTEGVELDTDREAPDADSGRDKNDIPF